ncbi:MULTISPECIES: zinc ribbon domain-containing protein [Photobacterium]|uniref:DNA ligase n=1 Tax=Photobacterium ganghwense TaxID=320778 RepID=A0A0J1HHN2_9GAMM|nr:MULTISPECIES: zinc ribbon domain-containing protein [Photobacterium]KLV11135.1 DNA ligase [Photobacterium ganghwense]MBV1840577.1 zinc ribbon domain-containing protein [Photobacterium ganghwense]PSU11403.1 DNA ligase [Photobacterium ganghwense]QSV13510.1 zinc ribbon domain-containing protein [Photobacterium ganghwense]
MEQNFCPECQTEMHWHDNHYHCEDCGKNWRKQAYCPDCAAQLEKLAACGAASYFCNQCNELKSKSRIRIEFVRAE